VADTSSKLYLIQCCGLGRDVGNGQHHGTAYVVACNPSEAYAKLRDELDRRKLGDTSERELKTIELVAELAQYPDCGIALFL